MGDFTGFTFDGVHSSELGIIRVSDGDRYKDNSSPEIKDINAEVPGMDGEYYFGTNFGTREFSIEIAYNSVTEVQLRTIRRIFSQKKICELVFDEEPYKKYLVKIANPIELNYVCFDEPEKVKADTERNGVRRDREKDREDIISVPIIDVGIIRGIEENSTETSCTLTQIPNGEVIISYILEGESTTVLPEGIELSHEEGTYTYVFSSDRSDDICVEFSYNYNKEITIPAWEQITPWEYTGKTRRIYKGEGSIELIAYYPFAKAIEKWLPYDYALTKDEEIQEDKKYYTYNGETNKYEEVENPDISKINTYYERVLENGVDEWATVSEILPIWIREKYNIDTVVNSSEESSDKEIPIYNPGDKETGFTLYIPYDSSNTDTYTISLYSLNSTRSVNIEDLEKPNYESNLEGEKESGFIINSNNGLIEGVIYDEERGGFLTTGNVYNKYIVSGHLFKLPITTVLDDGESQRTYRLYIKGTNIDFDNVKIDYTYLYY